MAFAGRITLRAFRNDPLRVTLSVRGVDLTGATFSFAVRQYPDQSGDALLGPLSNTTTTGQRGVRLVDVLTVDSVPTSLIEIIDTKANMQALPAAAEVGSGSPAEVGLSFDFQWTPADGDEAGFAATEQTWLFGDFIVMGSVNG
jgi:hypothetical protein